MPITEELMDVGAWSLTLSRDTPTSVLNSIDVRTKLWSSIVILPVDVQVDDISAANLLSMAGYLGVYLGMEDNHRTLYGQGLAWWFGSDGDGGELYAGVDATAGSVQFSTQLTNQVFSRSNGITAGSQIDATATAFTHNLTGGDTCREILDALCAMAPGGPNMWKINPAALTLDADDQTTLWPTTTAPGSVLNTDGGKDAIYSGFSATFQMAALNGEEVRSNIQVEWNEATPGTNNGSSSPSLSSNFKTPAGGTPVVRTLLNWSPKGRFPPIERWRKYWARSITVLARANSMAAREANERTSVRPEIVAELSDVYYPWRYTITPGNTVYVNDPDQNLVNRTNDITFRGETMFPTTGRVDEMTTPIQNGYGVYLRSWNGASMDHYRLTDYVEFEEGPTTLRLDHRERQRFALPTKARRVTRRQRRRLLQGIQLQRYLQRVAR